MLSKLFAFLKKEIVLTVSCILAIISCFIITPDMEYLGYVDMHTILILFCLMAVMAGLKDIGLFQYIGEGLLRKINSERGIVFILVFLCFFGSMLITNDVALITFVPLAILILKMANMEVSLCYIITLMTIAANLGSMMTPIGNPQNLYLYSVSGMSLMDFLMLMLPYTAVSGILLVIAISVRYCSTKVSFEIPESGTKLNRSRIIYYFVLFALCLLAVAKICPIWLLTIIVLAAVIKDNWNLLKNVDYALLATFIFFFVFIGNMGRFSIFRDFISSILDGQVELVAILSSQIISNVPAALLLSGFTNEWNSLIIGTNLGGLGTLIASMASLISYKQVVEHYPDQKGSYFKLFTISNIIFLIVLYITAIIL